jgi:hypothetical protein
MRGPTPPLSVQVADPSYGPGLDPTESETAEVATDVEGAAWRPLDPEPRPAGELVFVDGVQQVEAWITAMDAGDPEPIAGFAVAIGAGAVAAGPGRPAEITELSVRRLVLTVGDRRLRLPPVGGFSWEPQVTPAREVTGMARRVGQLRQQTEHELAERHAGPGRLVVLDGRLSFVRDAAGPIVGAIKSHHRMYLPPAEASVVGALRVGQRTPLFAIGTDRLSWYQRLPGSGEEGWAGILRGELPRSLGVAQARRLADRAAAELPRFAGRPHRDPRAPQNLAPVAALEDRLRHRLGDRRLALRAVRRAAAGATLEAAPGSAALAPLRAPVEPADPVAA